MRIPLPWRRLLKNRPELAARRYRWLMIAGAGSLILALPLLAVPWPILVAVLLIQTLLACAARRDLSVLTEWRRTPCIIQSTKVRHLISYTFAIDYGAAEGGRGAAEERTITGTRLSNIQFQQYGARYATHVASFFRPGDYAFCWYNPRNPNDCVLLRAPLWFYAPLLFPLSSLAAIAVGYLGLKVARLQTATDKTAPSQLFAEQPWVRLSAVRSMAGASDLLVRVMLDDEEYPRISRAACAALSECDDPRATAALGQAARKTHLRSAALTALNKQLDRGIALPPDLDLTNALADPQLRSTALDILVRLRDPRAVDVLLPMLTSEDESQRKASLRALDSMDANWRTGSQTLTAIPQFVSILADSSAVARRYAVFALVQIGSPAVDELIRFLETRVARGVVSLDAIEALAAIGDRRAVPVVLRAAERRITESIVEALGSFRDPRAVPLLTSLLNDPQAKQVHGKAAAALARIGVVVLDRIDPAPAPASKPLSDNQTSSQVRITALQSLFDSPQSDVGIRQAAIKELGGLASRSREAREILGRALAEPFTRGLAALGLARAGTSEALRTLARGIADEFPELNAENLEDPANKLLQCLRKHSYYEKVVWALEAYQEARHSNTSR
jgi:HEAT repeat protein